MLELVFLLDLFLQQQKMCFLACLYPHLWFLTIQSRRKCIPMLDLSFYSLVFQGFFLYILWQKCHDIASCCCEVYCYNSTRANATSHIYVHLRSNSSKSSEHEGGWTYLKVTRECRLCRKCLLGCSFSSTASPFSACK